MRVSRRQFPPAGGENRPSIVWLLLSHKLPWSPPAPTG